MYNAPPTKIGHEILLNHADKFNIEDFIFDYLSCTVRNLVQSSV